jgi:hypothetical protein
MKRAKRGQYRGVEALTNHQALPIVPAMSGLFVHCGICPGIIG